MLEPEVDHLADALMKTVYGIDGKEHAVFKARRIIAHLASVDYEIAEKRTEWNTDRDF